MKKGMPFGRSSADQSNPGAFFDVSDHFGRTRIDHFECFAIVRLVPLVVDEDLRVLDLHLRSLSIDRRHLKEMNDSPMCLSFENRARVRSSQHTESLPKAT